MEKKLANKVRLELTLGQEAGTKTGEFPSLPLAYDGSQRTDFHEFLKRFAVTREESFIDPDSFDYGFYNYGMQMYGNMPLIEENEYRGGYEGGAADHRAGHLGLLPGLSGTGVSE